MSKTPPAERVWVSLHILCLSIQERTSRGLASPLLAELLAGAQSRVRCLDAGPGHTRLTQPFAEGPRGQVTACNAFLSCIFVVTSENAETGIVAPLARGNLGRTAAVEAPQRSWPESCHQVSVRADNGDVRAPSDSTVGNGT